MGKRQPLIILKTDERKVVLDSTSATNSLPYPAWD